MSRTTRSARSTRQQPAERPMPEHAAAVEPVMTASEEAALIAAFPVEDYPGVTRSDLFVSGGRVFIREHHSRTVLVSETGKSTLIAAHVDLRENTWAPARSIRKPQVARMPWDTKGEAFDPARVSKSLSPAFHG